MKNLIVFFTLSVFCFTSASAQKNAKKEVVVETQLGDIVVDGQLVEAAEFSKQKSLVILGDNNYTVRSYRMIKAPKDGPAIMTSITGATLSEDAISILSRLKSGDRLIIEGILINDLAGAAIKASPLVYKVK